MTARFNPSDWVSVVPPERHGIFLTPYAEPASIVSQETGSDLNECIACGQLREHVVAVPLEHDSLGDLCSDCRDRHGL